MTLVLSLQRQKYHKTGEDRELLSPQGHLLMDTSKPLLPVPPVYSFKNGKVDEIVSRPPRAPTFID